MPTRRLGLSLLEFHGHLPGQFFYRPPPKDCRADKGFFPYALNAGAIILSAMIVRFPRPQVKTCAGRVLPFSCVPEDFEKLSKKGPASWPMRLRPTGCRASGAPKCVGFELTPYLPVSRSEILRRPHSRPPQNL